MVLIEEAMSHAQNLSCYHAVGMLDLGTLDNLPAGVAPTITFMN